MNSNQAFENIINSLIREFNMDNDLPTREDLVIIRRIFDAGVAYADSITPNHARQTLDEAINVLESNSPVGRNAVFIEGSEADKLQQKVDKVRYIFGKAFNK